MSQRVLVKMYAKGRSWRTDIVEVWFAGAHADVGGGSVDNETVHNLARIPLRWLVRECFRTHSGIIFSCDGLIGLDPDSLYPEAKPRPPALPVGDHRIQPTRSPKAHSRTQKEPALRNFATAEAAPESTKSEEELDLQDALCPLYDPLALTSGGSSSSCRSRIGIRGEMTLGQQDEWRAGA
ncbi:hypothetical protein B0H13DRAFT_2328432 [Mycena leptocephala]|nr:hypothetical protein B0H13DRAFT_2328432 [Mycena leptocephala]